MSLKLTRIRYKDLKPRQQENYNYQKLSGALANYGFVTMRLSSDWRGADLIAQHIDDVTFLKIQLKGRLTFCKYYIKKDLHIAFPLGDDWCLYPHDELLEKVHKINGLKDTMSWTKKGVYSIPSEWLSKRLYRLLNRYQIEPLQLSLVMED
jgi:hypothetical protein